MEVCPECGGHKVIKDEKRGELVCKSCGLVLEQDIIDRGPEWRAHDYRQWVTKSRVGAPMTYVMYDKGLSTTITPSTKDAKGRQLAPDQRAKLYRLRKLQRRVRLSDSAERNLASALSELESISSRLNLPRHVKETAALTYRNAVKSDLVKGKSIESVVVAAICAACRQHKVPRSMSEIADSARIEKKRLGKIYRLLGRKLGLKLKPTSPTEYVARFSSELGLSGEVQSKAIDIIKLAIDKEIITGKDPTGVAAAAIYIAGLLQGERRAQKEVAEVAGTSEVTVRNRYKELVEELDLEVAV
ncbi:MAG: transcription initiation factor IIB [Candidatus Hydrothermarchaeota archaeon]